jgi:hypothetical protein
VKLIGPEVAGDCRENEHPSATNKDNIEQATTKGLLVWSNPKRLTMFTDGTTSWYGCGNVARSAPSDQAFDCATAQARPTTGASTNPAPPGPTKSPDPDLGAITSCEHHIRPRLKAPSTAKYSGWFDSVTQPNPDGSVAVFAYVDAQNSFGAMIRTHYVCTVGPSAGANERRLISLTGL